MAKKAPGNIEQGRGMSQRFTGGEIVQSRVPSGIPLKFDEDQEAVLVYLGMKDITDKVPEKSRRGDERVMYIAFHDGRKVVSMPVGYAFSEIKWEVNKFYYIHHQGGIPMEGRNDMKDFDVRCLGAENGKVQLDGAEFVLTLPNIRSANYELLNYPLRKV